MNSLRETQRQIRIALVVILIVVSIGVIGFMLIEQMTLLDAIWMTLETLTTIGYGDIVPRTLEGRIFNILIIFVGLSAFAFGIQAGANFLISPAIRDIRQIRRIQRRVNLLENHYIICGVGEMVDKTISYLMQRAETRRVFQEERLYRPVDRILDRIFGDDAHGHYVRLRRVLRHIFLWFVRLRQRGTTMLDVIVVITTDARYAESLRSTGLLVIEGQPTDDEILMRAGIQRAQAMMVMLDSDAETLFTILTARSHNPNLYITGAALEEELAQKMTRAGANNVIAPFDVAGNFLNNATLRPAVNEFFSSILFEHSAGYQIIQLHLWDDSVWIGQHLGQLKLRERFKAGVIGLRLEDTSYMYAPGDNYVLKENEVVLAVCPLHYTQPLQDDCRRGRSPHARTADWQRLPMTVAPIKSKDRIYSLPEAEQAIEQMSEHFVICGDGRVARNSINKLNPERPFVIISDDEAYVSELLERGFRVVKGNPTHEKVLQKVGVNRALAAMVSVEDKADSVLTVLSCRTMSKRLLITATADSDDMIPKLHRAGADRVVSPFQIAAQFVLLATTSPAVSDFFQYVLFNYQVGLETTELYMEEDSPWIGETIESLRLDRLFRAGVLGIRHVDGSFIYAPPMTHIIGQKEVLIVTTPMAHSDELRLTAHGSATKRPRTLRRTVDSMRN